jgi:hypothetical protein
MILRENPGITTKVRKGHSQSWAAFSLFEKMTGSELI